MIFDLLRRHMRTILWVTVIVITPAFVMWGTGTGGGSTLSTATALQIEDYQISPREFGDAVRQAANRFGPDNAVSYAIDTIVDDYVIQQACTELGIGVSNADVQEYLKQIPTFRNPDGSFNAEQWNRTLRSKKANWEGLIESARQDLKRQKVRDLLYSTVQIGPAEVRAQYERDYARRRVAYAEFAPGAFAGEVPVGDEALQAYFTENQERYREPAQVRLAVVQWPKVAGELDKAEVHALLADIQLQLADGADFADLAEQYSQDGTRTNGGDLGWFDRTRMVEPFSEAAFALGVGEVSPPIQTEFGWHLIEVEDRRDGADGPEVRARHILLRETPGIDTLAALHEEATRFADGLGDESVADAARAQGLPVTFTEPLAQSALSVPAVANGRDVLTAAFPLEEGRRTELLDLPEAFVIAEVVERRDSGIPELADVRARVVADYRRGQAGAFAEERARDVAARAREAGDLAAVDAALVGEVVETDWFTRVGFVPNVGRPAAFMAAAFALEPGELSDPLPHGDRWFLLQVRETVSADPAGFETEAANIRRSLEFQRRAQVFEDFIVARKAKLTIRQNPEIVAGFSRQLS